jgi:hypothetical protein
VEFLVPNKFEMPEGSCFDNSGNIFIADAGKDSIYRFSYFGDELQSFGAPHYSISLNQLLPLMKHFMFLIPVITGFCGLNFQLIFNNNIPEEYNS